jgi:secretion/DNA translocation related TadE-like protein
MTGEVRARHPLRTERGSVSILAAALMVAIVVLALASSDLARVLTVASRAQTAADAAALAAAQELAAPTGATPGDVAREYAQRNGGELVSCTCDAGSDEAVVEVKIAVGTLLLFGGGRSVTGRARAVVDRGST